MGFSGNVGELERMAREVGAMQSSLLRRTAREGAFEFRRLLQQTLAARRTPEGTPWAPRRDGKPLADMTGAVRVTSTEDTITSRTVGKDAAYHHAGTSRMPARPMVPAPLAPMPPAWKLALDRAFTRAATLLMRSRA